MSIHAVGSDYFVSLFLFMGFSTHTYQGNCKDLIEYLEKNSINMDLVVLSRVIDDECMDKATKLLDNKSISYLVLPEPGELEKDNVDQYYDRIIKVLIGI